MEDKKWVKLTKDMEFGNSNLKKGEICKIIKKSIRVDNSYVYDLACRSNVLVTYCKDKDFVYTDYKDKDYEFKISDRVWDFEYGWGTVIDIIIDDIDVKIFQITSRPIVVSLDMFSSDKFYYSKCGTRNNGGARMLFFKEVAITNNEVFVNKISRAKKDCRYWYINSEGKISIAYEKYKDLDNNRYKIGNYFLDKSGAMDGDIYKTLNKR